jgi:hypothetical protein
LGPNRAVFHEGLDSWRLVMRVVVEKGLQGRPMYRGCKYRGTEV